MNTWINNIECKIETKLVSCTIHKEPQDEPICTLEGTEQLTNSKFCNLSTGQEHNADRLCQLAMKQSKYDDQLAFVTDNTPKKEEEKVLSNGHAKYYVPFRMSIPDDKMQFVNDDQKVSVKLIVFYFECDLSPIKQ